MPNHLQASVHAYRADFIEDTHTISLVVMKPSGEILYQAGDITRPLHMRSSAKPFQAQAVIQSGAYERFGFTLKELALCSASHEGLNKHIETARSMLSKLELSEDLLNCGAHLPINAEARKSLLAAGEDAKSIHNNCSGKHSGMLGIAKALGVSEQEYEKVDHPVQKLIFEIVQEMIGVQDIPYGIDGCSVPTFILPLTAGAQLYAQLAEPSTAPSKYREGLRTMFKAMQAHPDMIAGEGVIDTELMRAIPELAVKRGAQGYYGMALKDSKHGPLGISLKVDDGSDTARGVFVIKLLEFLAVLSPDVPMPWREQVIKNHRGIVTGKYQAEIKLS